MKIYFYTSVAASGLSLVLSIILFIFGGLNQSLQADVQKKQQELQKQQEEIQKGTTIAQNIGPKLLQDMANVAMKDDKMRALLKKYNYDIATPAPKGAPATGAAPAPAAPAAAPHAPAADGLRQP